MQIFTKLCQKEGIHLFVMLLMLHAMNIIIHQTRVGVLHEEGTIKPYSDFLDAIKY